MIVDATGPVVIAVAPTGARRTRSDHPALPLTPVEIAATAASCQAAGASLIHLHVRDDRGRHSLDADAYRKAIDAIRAAVGDRLVIQVTTETAGIYSPKDQMVMVRSVKPEAVSLALRELIPQSGDPAAPEFTAAEFLDWVVSNDIAPQYILHEADEIPRYCDLCARGVIPARRRHVLFVLGGYAAAEPSQAGDLLPFLRACDAAMPQFDSWSVCAFGVGETACAMATASLGGHIRVGFENNLQLSDGSVAPDNAALVSRVRGGVELIGRRVADATAARALLRG